MSAYATGHVKRDPETGAVAVRTVFPEDVPQLANQAWLEATPDRGAYSHPTSDVEAWEDLYVPPAPEPEPGPGDPAPGE